MFTNPREDDRRIIIYQGYDHMYGCLGIFILGFLGVPIAGLAVYFFAADPFIAAVIPVALFICGWIGLLVTPKAVLDADSGEFRYNGNVSRLDSVEFVECRSYSKSTTGRLNGVTRVSRTVYGWELRVGFRSGTDRGEDRVVEGVKFPNTYRSDTIFASTFSATRRIATRIASRLNVPLITHHNGHSSLRYPNELSAPLIEALSPDDGDVTANSSDLVVVQRQPSLVLEWRCSKLDRALFPWGLTILALGASMTGILYASDLPAWGPPAAGLFCSLLVFLFGWFTEHWGEHGDHRLEISSHEIRWKHGLLGFGKHLSLDKIIDLKATSLSEKASGLLILSDHDETLIHMRPSVARDAAAIIRGYLSKQSVNS